MTVQWNIMHCKCTIMGALVMSCSVVLPGAMKGTNTMEGLAGCAMEGHLRA